MPQSIEDTLRELDAWYNDPSCQVGDKRPELLSKLALLELCGWIEGTFDELILAVDQLTLQNDVWTRKEVIKHVSGFQYAQHLRSMLTKLVGEVFARRVEQTIEETNPGDLDRLRIILSSLWEKRCKFAHSDMVMNIASQTSFDAPSWALAQYRTLKGLVDNYRTALTDTLQGI